MNTGLPEKKLCWRITRICNLNCPFCLAGNWANYPDTTRTSEALQVISLLKECGFARVGISGGEPLLRPDLLRILEECVSAGVQPTVTTNATLFDDSLFDFFSTSRIKLKISLHGPRDVHNSVVGIDTYNTVFSAVTRLCEDGAQVTINSVVSRKNSKDFLDMLKAFDDIPIERVVFQFMAQRERARGLGNICLDTDEKEIFRSQIQNWARDESPNFVVDFKDFSSERTVNIVIETDRTVILASNLERRDIILGACSGRALEQAYDAIMAIGIIESQDPTDILMCERQVQKV